MLSSGIQSEYNVEETGEIPKIMCITMRLIREEYKREAGHYIGGGFAKGSDTERLMHQDVSINQFIKGLLCYLNKWPNWSHLDIIKSF